MTPPTEEFCFQLGYENGNTLHSLPATWNTRVSGHPALSKAPAVPRSDRIPWCCSLTLVTRGLLFDHGQRRARRGLAQRVPPALLDLHLHLGEGRSSLEGSTRSWKDTPRRGTGEAEPLLLDSHSKPSSAFWLNH